MTGSSTLDRWQGAPHLLSNISDDRRQLIEQAISNTGRTDLYCRDDAFAMHRGENSQYRLDGYFGLYIKERRDCSDFWAEVTRLEATDYWQTYLGLVGSI